MSEIKDFFEQENIDIVHELSPPQNVEESDSSQEEVENAQESDKKIEDLVDKVYKSSENERNLMEELKRKEAEKKEEEERLALEDPEVERRVFQGSEQSPGKVTKYYTFTLVTPDGNKNTGYRRADYILYDIKKVETWNSEKMNFDEPEFYQKVGEEYVRVEKNDLENIHNMMLYSLSDFPYFLNNPDSFGVSLRDLRKYAEQLSSLFAQFKIDKEKNDAQYEDIRYIPEFSFDTMLSDFRKLLNAIEDYLYYCFNRNVTKDYYEFSSNNETLRIPYYYFYGDNFDKKKIRDRVESSVMALCVLERVRFFNRQIKTVENEKDIWDEITDYPEIISVTVKVFQEERDLWNEDNPTDPIPDVVTVYRPFLYGDYNKLKETMKLPYVRYLLGNYYRFQEYMKKNKKISWREFLAYFVRPPIKYSYISQKENVAEQETLSILKTPEEVKKERESAEKNRVSKIFPQKTESVDSGFLSNIEKKLESLDPNDVHKVVKKFKLDNLALLAVQCALQHVDLPHLKIPPVYLPRFDFNVDLSIKDPSGGMFKKILEDITNISFSTVIARMKKFFSVEECKDFNRLVQRKSWADFFHDLKTAIKTDFRKYVKAIKNDLHDLDTYLAKSLCDPEVFLVSLYTSDICISPVDTENLLSGKLDSSSLITFSKHVNRVAFLAGCQTSLLPEDVAIVYATIARHFPPKIIQSYVTPDKEDIVGDVEKLRCENAFSLYLKWLQDNGVTPDVIECLKEKNIVEKSKILDELYEYSQNYGKESISGKIVVEDENSKNFLLKVFDSAVGRYFISVPEYLELFSVYAGSILQPYNFEDVRENFLNSLNSDFFTLESGDPQQNLLMQQNMQNARNKMRNMLDESELTKSSVTPFSVGEQNIHSGRVFWDFIDIGNRNAHKHIVSLDPTSYTFSLPLSNGETIYCVCKRQTGDLYYRYRDFSCGTFRIQKIFENRFLIDNIELYREIPNYRKEFSNYLWTRVPDRFREPDVRGFFDHIFEKELFDYLSKNIIQFFIDEMFVNNPVLKDYEVGGSSFRVSGMDIFLSFFRDVIDQQKEDGVEKIFVKDEWFQRFYEDIMRDFKYSGEYKIEKFLKRYLYYLKARFVAFLYRLVTLNIARFSGKDDYYFVSSYLCSVYQNIIDEFLDKSKDYIVEQIREMTEKLYQDIDSSDTALQDARNLFEKSSLSNIANLSDEARKIVENIEPIPDNGLYDSEPDYSFDSFVIELKEELSKVSKMFSTSLTGGLTTSPLGGFLRSLKIRNFDGRVSSVHPSFLSTYYNDFNIQLSKFDLFLETYFIDTDGEIRAFSLVSGTRKYSRNENLYAKYNNKTPISVLDLFDAEKVKTIPNFFVSVSFAKYLQEPDGFLFGRDFDIEYIIPLFSVEIHAQNFYEFWKQNERENLSPQDKEQFLFSYLFAQLEQDKTTQLFFNYILGLDEVFDYCNLFVFETMRKTTKCDFIFDSKFDLSVTPPAEDKDQNLNMEEAMNVADSYSKDKDAQSDTFGILRRSSAITAIQKMAAAMAEETPKLIFRAFVEMTDKNIAAARYIVDNNRFGSQNNRKKLDIRFVSLVLLLPSNIWPPPLGIGPPITPLGLMYLALESSFLSVSQKSEKTKEEVAKTLEEIIGEEIILGDEGYYLNILHNVAKNCYMKKEEDKKDKNIEVEKSCIL